MVSFYSWHAVYVTGIWSENNFTFFNCKSKKTKLHYSCNKILINKYVQLYIFFAQNKAGVLYYLNQSPVLNLACGIASNSTHVTLGQVVLVLSRQFATCDNCYVTCKQQCVAPAQTQPHQAPAQTNNKLQQTGMRLVLQGSLFICVRTVTLPMTQIRQCISVTKF